VAKKIKCDCGITFRPEEGQTHCNYCGIKISDIGKKNINSKREQRKQSEKINYSSFSSTHSVLIILIILLLSSVGYLYAKNEKLKRNIAREEKSLGVKVAPEVFQPTPTLKPRTNNSDPMVNCKSDLCDGGKIRQSECNSSTCCQIGNKWIFYLDKNKCIEDQKDLINSAAKPKVSENIECSIGGKIYNYPSWSLCFQAQDIYNRYTAGIPNPKDVSSSILEQFNRDVAKTIQEVEDYQVNPDIAKEAAQEMQEQLDTLKDFKITAPTPTPTPKPLPNPGNPDLW